MMTVMMKRTILLTCCLAALAAGVVAGPVWDGVTNLVSTLKSDGTTNYWTEADLVDALGLLNRRYWRDMSSASGRKAWHGAVAASAMHCVTNGATVLPVRVDTYADGYVHSETGAARRVLTPEETAALISKRKDARAQRIETLRSRLAAYEETIAAGVGATAEQRLAYAKAVVGAADCKTQLERLENAGVTNVVTVLKVIGGR